SIDGLIRKSVSLHAHLDRFPGRRRASDAVKTGSTHRSGQFLAFVRKQREHIFDRHFSIDFLLHDFPQNLIFTQPPRILHWQAMRSRSSSPKTSFSASLNGVKCSIPSVTSITHVPHTPSVHANGTPASSHASVRGESSGSSTSSWESEKISLAIREKWYRK